MPRYQYRCDECRHEFERPEPMAEHDKAHPDCPECGGHKVRQIFTTFYAKTSSKT